MTVPAWQRIIQKLRTMDRHELAHRSRQAFDKRSDALLSRFGYDFAKNAVLSGSSASSRFFFPPEETEPLLEALRRHLPGQCEEIISRADRICAHRFDLLGFEDLPYGEIIDWHLDLVHGKRAPVKLFHQMRYLDFAEVGDSKITWELNRHQHLVTLAKAYRLTRNQRYAAEILSQWKTWHAANPYPRGINWASSLEVACRTLSWIWVYCLLEGTEVLDANFRKQWLRAQALNGRHLERYLSTYFSPNTHLLGEGVGLFFLGMLCRELSGAERWKRLGRQIVLDEARRQVNPDGLHFEQSTYYHVYALDFFLHAILLASANGMSVPKELEVVLEKMLDALAALGAGGPPPSFGDDDGGRLFDPSRNRAEHLLDPLAAGAILFDRGDFKRLSGDLREETIWLLGLSGLKQWHRLEAKSATASSAAYANAGLYALATDLGTLMMHSGPSTAQSRGHDHADALSICLQGGGRALLIDPGTCEYVGPTNERNRFRSTAMHNTLSVDGLDQSEQDGPFSWKQPLFSRTEQWISGASFTLLMGSHDGYKRLPAPVVHRRWTVALKSGLFLVRDIAEGSGLHQLDIFWHLAADLHVEAEHLFRFKNASQGLAILPVQGHGWAESTHKGTWSPVYGQQSSALVLNFGASVALPAEFVTLLVPLAEMRAPGILTRLETSDATSVQAYRYKNEHSECTFCFAHPDQPWTAGEISSDAEFVCVLKSSESAHNAIFCHGSYVDFSGTRLLATKTRVERCELAAGRCFCSDPDAVTQS